MTEQFQEQQAQQQMHPKNPNGGYLKPSDYGADQFFGAIVLTRPLVEFLYNQGGDVKINIKVNELKNGEYGAYRRITAKPLTAEQTFRMSQTQAQTQPAPVPQVQGQPQPMQQMVAPAETAPAPIQVPPQEPMAPTPQYVAPTPIQEHPPSQAQPVPVNSQVLEDEIPF